MPFQSTTAVDYQMFLKSGYRPVSDPSTSTQQVSSPTPTYQSQSSYTPAPIEPPATLDYSNPYVTAPPQMPSGFQQITQYDQWGNPDYSAYTQLGPDGKAQYDVWTGEYFDGQRSRTVVAIQPIQKATVINSQGERQVVRITPLPSAGQGRIAQGADIPTASSLTQRGFVLEKSPGIPSGPFPDTGTMTPTVQTGMDMSIRPSLKLPSGQIISSTDPNYDAYAVSPGVTKMAVQNTTSGYQTYGPTGAATSMPLNAPTSMPAASGSSATSATGLTGGAGTTSVASRYGNTNDENANFNGYLGLDGFLDLIRKNPSAGIDTATLDAIRNDPAAVSKLISAIAYGSYTLADVYREIKRQDMVRKGDTSMASVTIIDPSKTREEYVTTAAGKMAYSNPTLEIPKSLNGLSNPDILSLKLYQMPDWGFKELVPALDMNSEEFKKEVEGIKDAYHDVILSQLNAQSEREKTAADYNYQQLKKSVEEKYGLQLSDNSLEAWKQIEGMGDAMAQRGLAGTGMANEQMDDYLRQVRETDRRVRESGSKEEDSRLAEKLAASGSPAEIQALINEDKAKGLPREQWRAVKWGLVPSESSLASLDVNKLMTDYGLDKDTAQRYHDSIIDENGNYRSSLFQNYYNKIQETKDTKYQSQVQQLLNQNLKKEQDKYFNWSSDPNSQFSSYIPEGAETSLGTNYQGMTDGYFNLNNTNTPTTPLPSPINSTPTGSPSTSTLVSATNIPFKSGLSTTQQQSIQSLALKPTSQWSATDKTNWSYATNGAPLPGTGSTGTSTQPTANTSTSYNIPFKSGLSAAQQQSISLLAQKPTSQWSDTDKANWNYATNNAPTTSLYSNLTSTVKASTPTTTTPTTQNTNLAAAGQAASTMGTGTMPTGSGTTTQGSTIVPTAYKGTADQWYTTNSQLNTAYQRVQSGSGSDTDKANIAYATKTYSWKPTI